MVARLDEAGRKLKSLTGAPNQSRRLIEKVQNAWPKSKPLVSVIIPCFNYGTVLHSALNSVFAQSFQDFEIIIVESGSTDTVTADIIRQISLAKTRVFMRRGRHLVGDNRNYGIKKARGKYICCLDPDDTIDNMFLERALFLLECAGYDIVSTSYRYFGERNEDVVLPARPSFAQISGGASSPNLSVFEKSFWAKVGGYHDTGIGAEHIPEDWDFYLRAAGLGARMFNLQDPLLNVHWHQDSLHRDDRNPAYNVQRQILHERHNDIMQHKHFEKFHQRNEAIIRLYSGTRNLVERQVTGKNFGTLIIPPSSLNESEMNLHLQQIDQSNSNGRKVIMCFSRLDELPDKLLNSYSSHTHDMFSLDDVANDPQLKITLLDYLIESRRIRSFIVGSSIFGHDNSAQLSSLYDRLEYANC